MMEPQEIEDEEHEQILERAAAVDVAKASGMVCTRVPHQAREGKRRTRVWQVDATTNTILELADHLAAEGIGKVTLESTSDYWRIWFYLLEAAGLDVQLVRARDVKQAPGRPKTDKRGLPGAPAGPVILQGAAGAFPGGGIGPGDHERLHLGVMHPGGSQVGQGVQVVRAGPAQHQFRGLQPQVSQRPVRRHHGRDCAPARPGLAPRLCAALIIIIIIIITSSSPSGAEPVE